MKLLNKIYIKRISNRINHILSFPQDVKFIFFNKKKIKNDGMVLVIHESNRLGASLLLLHTAEELRRRNKNIYIISLQFGELNQEYNKYAPIKIIFSKLNFKRTLRKLKRKYGYRKILMLTAAVGDYVKIAHNLGFKVVSEIHELPFVIEQLGLQNATKEMLIYSDAVVFSTNAAKKMILNQSNIRDSYKFIVKPQGIYYKKPSNEKINYAKKQLQETFPILSRKKLIIGIGNTSYRKGFDLFVNVAKIMPQYVFLWAGKKERFFNTVKKEENSLSSNFIYVGQLNDEQLAGVYSSAAALLLCSRVDTLPSTVFEALLFNIPVIGSKTSGGVSDVINDRKNGLLTNDVSVDEFSKAIKEIFSDTTQEEIHKYFSKASIDNSFVDYISFILQLYL